MLTEYLDKRKKVMENEIKLNSEKLEHNLISIKESEKQKIELECLIDEASEMFSTKARVDSEHKNSEIRNINEKIVILKNENKILEKNINNLQEELNEINKSLEELENEYVSRETKYKRRRPTIKKEVIDKLKLCKEISTIDNVRVAIEIEEILKLLT